MKVINLAASLFLILATACAKHGTFANPSPAIVPELNTSVGPQSQCVHIFTSAMSPTEVALAAIKMKEVCKMSENEIINLAENF